MNVRNFPSWEELNKIMDGMIELGSKEKECDYHENIHFFVDVRKENNIGTLTVNFQLKENGESVGFLILDLAGVISHYPFGKESYDMVKEAVDFWSE